MDPITPPFPLSKFIISATPDPIRIHKGDGDMWPVTWGADGNLYGAAGDNMDSPMNFWKITGDPNKAHSWSVAIWNIHNRPVDPAVYCHRPHVHPEFGVKPAGLLSMNGVIYLATELHNYGEDPGFRRQQNISSWIITTADFGQTGT